MLLDVRGLNVSVKLSGNPLRLLHDVSFSLDSGEVFLLVGESGCGKTTLARALTNLFPRGLGAVIEGTVEFEGHDLISLDAKGLKKVRRKLIRYVFQEPAAALNPALHIRSQIRLLPLEEQGSGNGFRKPPDEAIHQSLVVMGIKDPKDILGSYPHQLSVGTLQRILIAMAITSHPKLLIADEPTSAVDAVLQYQILDLLHSYCKMQNMALLLITHDLGIAHRYADKIAVLYAGRIVEAAARDEFFQNPLHPYSQILLASAPTATRSLEQMPSSSGNVPSLAHLPKGCKFHPRCYKVQDDCKVQEPRLIPINERRHVRCPYWK